MNSERLQAMVDKHSKLKAELKQLPAQALQRGEMQRTLKLLDAEINRLRSGRS